MSGWIDKYGKPFPDHELRAIESGDYRDRVEAVNYLGFTEERFEFRDVQAVSCRTCGALFTGWRRHLRAHRRTCGWDNGSPAWGEQP